MLESIPNNTGHGSSKLEMDGPGRSWGSQKIRNHLIQLGTSCVTETNKQTKKGNGGGVRVKKILRKR